MKLTKLSKPSIRFITLQIYCFNVKGHVLISKFVSKEIMCFKGIKFGLCFLLGLY